MLLEIQTDTETASESVDRSDYESFTTIERISSSELDYNAFAQRFMLRNLPVIITGIPDDWDCFRNWTLDRVRCHLNVSYLRQHIAERLTENVPVADCHRRSRAGSDAHTKLSMDFAAYLDHWQSADRPPAEDEQPLSLYLKDWHLRQTLPEYSFYRTPAHFASDWLNESLLEAGADDYRFVYMGPAGTWTPFHSDVYGSFSWSTNVAGTKRWLLLPPGEERKLSPDADRLPFSVDAKLLDENAVRYFVVEQTAGETLFVPSCWYHQVHNVTAAISVNHNWLNAFNVRTVWAILRAEYERVRREISDCRDMDDFHGHCQLMLRASHGMNFDGMLACLRTIAMRRIRVLEVDGDGDCNDAQFDGFRFGREHCTYDLRTILQVLDGMQADDLGDNYPAIRGECIRLAGRIAQFV